MNPAGTGGKLAQPRTRIRIILVLVFFIVYFFAAARPIPRELVLAHKWISSLELEVQDTQSSTGTNISTGYIGTEKELVPFALGSRFGYVDPFGNFAVNKVKNGEIYLSRSFWAEYDAEPSSIEIKNISSNTVVNIEDPRGYPILLDDRIFILGSEQNSLSEIDMDGNTVWTYEFGSPLTCIDAAAGLILTGSIDGIVEILDSSGKRIFYFEPGGSRYAVILGCAISGNGSRIGIISGVDQQRFLMLERFGDGTAGGGTAAIAGNGGDYRVVYHEFLDMGFRRPVRISFIDQDRRIVFERQGGLGYYNIKSRKGLRIPLEGEITAIDDFGDRGLIFLITSLRTRNELIGIKFPQDNWIGASRLKRDMRDTIFIRAPFKSDDVFLSRNNSMLIAGGGKTLISFGLEEK
jgi:hypothetical protein